MRPESESGRGDAAESESGRGDAAESESGRGDAAESESGRGGAAESESGRGGVAESESGRGGTAETECGRGGAARFGWGGWSWMCVGGECHTGYMYMVHGCRNNNSRQTTQSITKDITITKNCKDDAVRGVSKNNQWCDPPCGIDAYHRYYSTIQFDFYN